MSEHSEHKNPETDQNPTKGEQKIGATDGLAVELAKHVDQVAEASVDYRTTADRVSALHESFTVQHAAFEDSMRRFVQLRQQIHGGQRVSAAQIDGVMLPLLDIVRLANIDAVSVVKIGESAENARTGIDTGIADITETAENHIEAHEVAASDTQAENGEQEVSQTESEQVEAGAKAAAEAIRILNDLSGDMELIDASTTTYGRAGSSIRMHVTALVPLFDQLTDPYGQRPQSEVIEQVAPLMHEMRRLVEQRVEALNKLKSSKADAESSFGSLDRVKADIVTLTA